MSSGRQAVGHRSRLVQLLGVPGWAVRRARHVLGLARRWLVPGVCCVIILVLGGCFPSEPIQRTLGAELDDQGRVVVHLADCPDGTPSKVEVVALAEGDMFNRTLLWSATRVDVDGPAPAVVVVGEAPDGFETDVVLDEALEDGIVHFITFTEGHSDQYMGWERRRLVDAPEGALYRGNGTYVDASDFPSTSECWWD